MAEQFEATVEVVQLPIYPVVEVVPRDDGRVVEVIVPVNEATMAELQAFVAAAFAAQAANAPPPISRTMLDVAKNASQAIGGAFTRITFDAVKRDPGSAWDAVNNWYTCPVTGVYLITGVLRVADGAAAGSQYTVGVHTAEADGAGWNQWTKVGPAPATRTSHPYSRISYQNAGDRLRMFSFSDTAGGVNIQSAGLQIILLSR